MKNIFKIALAGVMLFGSAQMADASVTTKKNAMPVEITPVPGYQLITLDEAKDHLNIELGYTEKDADIQGKVYGAVSIASDYLNRAIVNATFVQTQDNFCSVTVRDWRDAVLTSVKIKYDGEVEFTDLPADSYTQLYKGGFGPGVMFKDLPEVYELRTEFALTVPYSVKSAALLILADLYEYREDRGDVYNRRAQTLLRAHRNYV